MSDFGFQLPYFSWITPEEHTNENGSFVPLVCKINVSDLQFIGKCLLPEFSWSFI